ncbi:MAG TPA: sterol desaturase family protein [Acidimicrobiales bacterium]|nr:sterol desaturase family protein [Acidimicrobiales bacterium]
MAVPFYFATMGLEYLWLRRRAATRAPSAGNYERRDTVASLTMGVASLLAPTVSQRVLRPVTPGRGRFAKTLVVGALGAVALTTAADALGRRARRGRPAFVSPPSSNGSSNGSSDGSSALSDDVAAGALEELARKVSAVGGVATVVAGGLVATTFWNSRTTPERLWRRRLLPDLGTGPLVALAAVCAWDFVYYWDHRFMHSSRYMWAVHVVHHSSEHYNLSTALRQPVAEALGTFVPFGALCLFGIRPSLVETARGVNLLYQYWIHTETIGRLGPSETVLNTPSHHRVHHGSNKPYLDRNHGSILIVWDKLFGTFEPEGEPVVYGLTKNINTFNPLRIAFHEHLQMLGDVSRATSWRERLSYVVRHPGWRPGEAPVARRGRRPDPVGVLGLGRADRRLSRHAVPGAGSASRTAEC